LVKKYINESILFIIPHLFVILSQKMASANTYRLDQRVTIAGKGLGTIAFMPHREPLPRQRQRRDGHLC
jgi:hypothetical protein